MEPQAIENATAKKLLSHFYPRQPPFERFLVTHRS